MSEELHDKLDQMAALCAQQIDTIKKFKRALRIAELAGVPPKELKARVGTRVVQGPHMWRPWLKATFVLEIDEVKMEFPLGDVHHDLWPDDLLAQYKRHNRRTA